MNVKRVIVTGANGFIGQQVCRQLVESGREVTACIRERADSSVFGDILNSLKIYRMPASDLTSDLSKVFRNVDAVIHLAGRVHVMRELSDDPLSEFRKVNVAGTEHLAEIAAKNGVGRFVYISSIKVNGETTHNRAYFADDSPGFCDPYGQSKWEAEERLREIASNTSMQCVIARPPLVYGPGVKGNFLALMKFVARGIPLPLGSIQNKRSMVSVFNLSDLLCVLVDHPAAANNRFLVSDSEDVSTPELVRRMAAALHQKARLVPCPESFLMAVGGLLGKGEAVQRLCSSLVLDRTKTTEVLGWTPPLDLDSGLARTAQWFLEATQSAAQ